MQQLAEQGAPVSGLVDLGEVIEHVPALVMRLSHIGDNWKTWFVTANVSMYGYRRDELMNGDITWTDLCHPDDRVVCLKQVHDYETRGIDEYRLYYRIVTKQGDSIPVVEYNTVSRNEDGSIYCYDTVILNTTLPEASSRLIDDHFRQQTVLSDIMMSLHSSDLDHALQLILDRTGEYLDTSRALLFQDSPDHVTCKVVYEWLNKGISSIKELDYAVTYSTEMPEIYIALQDTGVLLVDYGEIPENCKEEFESEGLIASAIFAVYLHGEHYGFVCFDDCVVERKWDEDTARFLKNISNLISTVLVRQSAARRLEMTQRTCETVLDNVDSYIFVTLPESSEIVFANRSFRDAFEQDCEGKNYSAYLPLKVDKHTQKTGYEELYSEKTGEWLHVATELVDWVDGRIVRLFTCYDISSKKMYEDSIEKMAFEDHLTGLPNRYRCDVELQEAIDDALATARSGHVLFIDLDDFKIVNDSYGHDYGDGVLISFARYLQSIFPPPHTVFRFGGDEFVVLLRHEQPTNVDDYLQTLLSRAKQPWKALDKEFYCTLSIGVIQYPGGVTKQKTLLKNADIAMYEAKRRGKNKFEFYQPGLDESTMLRSHMEAIMRRAMADNFSGFRILYQPVVDLASGEVCGMEALIRMLDGKRTIVPQAFLPLADYLGFIIPIGEHVLRETARHCKRINESGRPDFTATVNLSSRQVAQKDIVARIEHILEEVGVNRQNVVISLSENTVVEEPDRMLVVCSHLRALGMRVVLDDFGGGNSSFIRLRSLPIDVIKIGPSFVETLNNEYSRSFVELLVGLSHSIGKKVCLSGIEREWQLEFCRDNKVDEVQGFYIHMPCEIHELNL